MKFSVRKINFAGPTSDDEDDEGRDLPKPMLLRLQRRRAAGIAEAADTLANLPGPGESLHCVMTARLDMADVLNALLDKLGRCERLMIATLGYNRRNYKTMLHWLDSGVVRSLSLVASLFFRAHNAELFEETLQEFGDRGQRAVCCPCHAKVMTLTFANGVKMTAESSANLCSNGSARENLTLIHDATLHDWHSAWIEALVKKHA